MRFARVRSLGLTLLAATSTHAACSNRYEEDCAFTSRCVAGESSDGGGAGESGVSGDEPGGAGASAAGGAGTSGGGEPDVGGGAGAAAGTGGRGGGGDAAGAEGGQAAGAGGSPPACDLDASPRDEPCVLDQGAIYVSPNGSDANGVNGTRSDPVRSFGRALSLASGRWPVVACSGAYAEQVTITGGAKIYGGFECSTWTPSAMPTVVKPASGVALTIRGVPEDEEVLIEGIEFHASSATQLGQSSIAAIVLSSKNVEIRSGRLVAGDGKEGASATDPTAYTTRAANGNTADTAAGGAIKPCNCLIGGVTTGGSGGHAATSTEGPGGGGDGLPPLGGGQGGDAEALSCVEGLGRSGAPGEHATTPAEGVGAKIRGRWSEANGFTPEPGKAGAAGKVGQGGGGGRGGETGGGGGGGCGGCAGKGGEPGQGGGASIALIAIDSEVTLPGTKLAVGKAGNGGRGAKGQEGQEGGGGGLINDNLACPGGSGGKGGSGAAGGGGAGGIAVGVLYRGVLPATDEGASWFAKSPSGLGGEGGEGGDAAGTSDDGISGGESVESLSISQLSQL